jgi:hypothetical protein
MASVRIISAGTRRILRAKSNLCHSVVSTKRDEMDTAVATRDTRKVAPQNPCLVIVSAPTVRRGSPLVIKRAGIAITAVKIGMNTQPLFRKNTMFILENAARRSKHP